MIPCLICNIGANAEFDRWEIIVEGTLEMLCAVYVCKSCDAPTWVQMGIREADEIYDDDDDDNPADMSAGWEP